MSNKKILVVAYYTKNTSYQELSEKLRDSCKLFSIRNYIKGIDNLGSWESNTHFKARFLLDCLLRFQEDILYVDVDALFRSYPTLVENMDCDIAYRTENFKWRNNEALSGTIYLKYSTKTVDLVRAWININESNPSKRYEPQSWEQANMQKAVLLDPNIKYYNLPPEYTFIFDFHRKLYPGLIPVIEHFQNSRSVFKNNKL